MPTIADILRSIDSVVTPTKRRIVDALMNPRDYAAQAFGNVGDGMARFNENAVMAQEGADLRRQGSVMGDLPQYTNAQSAVLQGLMGAMPVGQVVSRQVGQMPFDARFDPRKKEQARLSSLLTAVDERPMQPAPNLDLSKYEGYPFITSMSDRTAAGGELVGINGVDLRHKVDLRGGQDYMFDGNNGQVWASANGPVKQILGLAQDVKRVTGKDPLYMPWTMAPSGGDFANMTGETMLSYAASSMNKRGVKALDKDISAFIPGWAGISTPAGIEQFRAAPDKVRKAIKGMMDVKYRDAGGLSIGEARLAVADPKQLKSADGGLLNVGQIDADAPMVRISGHPAYPRGVPGEGLGKVPANTNVYQMLPNLGAGRGLDDLTNPRTTDLRALQMKPYAGLLDADLLRSLGY